MSNAERLRKTAADMREKARDVWEYHSPAWYTTPGPAGWSVIRAAGQFESEDGEQVDADTFVLQMDTTGTAAYIAAMHPAVALAVADWLDKVASVTDRLGNCPEPSALVVCAAYWGDQ